ncbi:hypothetical protein BAU15_03970 [Enterococcus sp. JM4C]|uniref:GyrI-like domain-containing protein n=1 Tax=Candidatus Enterococcus huntleyi TaxID=1857217 RepID=UPI00137B2760|nr:GyrI-like domain-containing protein [Enterococcus sp. JM4C]KAF1295701.1 hypothetical protein BAU15_03970 [Enterococcus sp. JM4C]
MKYEWRKQEKSIYLPKANPQVVEIPKMNYLVLTGKGNPNSELFAQQTSALYALSYDFRMACKKGILGEEPLEYVVYPLEGIWTTGDGSRGETLNKEALEYRIMIRQHSFITQQNLQDSLERLAVKKPNPHYEGVTLEEYQEGTSVQMLHVGSYDQELASFQTMDHYLQENNLKRVNIMERYIHREIYLSDPRKVAADKLKTVLRYQVEKQN